MITLSPTDDKLWLSGKMKLMNGGKKKNRDQSPEFPNKKISQKFKLVLGNKALLHEAGIMREKMMRTSLRKFMEEAMKLDARFSVSIREQLASNSQVDWIAFWASFTPQDAVAKSKIESHPTIVAAARLLATKYELEPLLAWTYSLVSLILYGYSYPPIFESLRDLTPLLIKLNPKKRAEAMNAISELRQQNFGILARKDEYTGKMSLYIQLLGNTSKNDIVRGWGAIKKIKDLALGKGNFYPLKNLDLASKISSLDESEKSASDWEKRDKLFGGDDKVMTPEIGVEESKQRKKIKQTRYSYKKRFGTKS